MLINTDAITIADPPTMGEIINKLISKRLSQQTMSKKPT
jgi:hypothetical protein